MALHAIKAGEGDVFISAGVEMVSRFVKGNSDALPDTQNPLFADAEARTAKVAESGADSWHDPREDGDVPDVYIAMGQTAENLALLKGVTRAGAWTSSASASQNLAEKAIDERLLGARDHPGHAARRHRRQQGRRPARRRHLRGRLRGSSRCSAPTAGSPPATAARSTTAPPRWSS